MIVGKHVTYRIFHLVFSLGTQLNSNCNPRINRPQIAIALKRESRVLGKPSESDGGLSSSAVA